MSTGNLWPSSRGARVPKVSNRVNHTCLSFAPSPTPRARRLQDPDCPRPAVVCTLMRGPLRVLWGRRDGED